MCGIILLDEQSMCDKIMWHLMENMNEETADANRIEL